MTRFCRKISALLALLVLLFTQLTVAAYACPSAGNTGAFAPSGASEPPCHGMDRSQANLCKQHCEQNSQSFDRAANAVVGIPVLPLIAVAAPVSGRVLLLATLQSDLLVYDSGPPLSIRHCCIQV
ncbi:MAG TPA: hypothetical protein VM532_01045 [Burkholderiales bacterium]|nr:hypothetical protein [Burkholderiales bacterium]